MMNENSKSRDFASSNAKPTEGCLSTPKDLPCGQIGAFSGPEKVRRAGPDGPSLLTRVGLVMKLQSVLGCILSACCRLSFRLYRTLYDLEERVWYTWEEPIVSERHLDLLDGWSRLPPSQARFAFMRDLPGMEGPQEVPHDTEVIDPFTGEIIVPASPKGRVLDSDEVTTGTND